MSTLITSCALLLASAAPAMAQPTAEEPGARQPASEDIIVTGEKADRTIQHTTPASPSPRPKS